MLLHKLKPVPGSRPKKHIVGRGEGSGLGQTAGKGQKGQTSRSGDTVMTGFEGGQTPLHRRIPKRGFRHPSKIFYQAVNLGDLEAIFDKGATVNAATLHEKGFLKKPNTPFKILANGKLTKSLTIVAPKFSQSALKLVEKAGGTLAAK